MSNVLYAEKKNVIFPDQPLLKPGKNVLIA
jgi:hypothetical protein